MSRKRTKTPFEEMLRIELTVEEFADLQDNIIGYQRFRFICRKPEEGYRNELTLISNRVDKSEQELIDDYHFGDNRITVGQYKAIRSESLGTESKKRA